MPPQMLLASAFELPQGLADHVETKRRSNSSDARFHLEFDVGWKNRLIAQGAKLTGSVTAPHVQRSSAGKLGLCDALARDGPQFCF